MSEHVDKWKVVTKEERLEEDNKRHEEFILKYGEKNLIKDGLYGKLFCCICGNFPDKAVVGEVHIYTDDGDVEICVDCIEKLYKKIKER